MRSLGDIADVIVAGGELAVEESSEQTVAATDLLEYLPKAIERVSSE